MRVVRDPEVKDNWGILAINYRASGRKQKSILVLVRNMYLILREPVAEAGTSYTQRCTSRLPHSSVLGTYKIPR